MSEYEWSYPAVATELDRKKEYALEATPAECKAIAARSDVPAIHAMHATATITPDKVTGNYTVTGKVYARLDQICARTGDVFTHDMEGDIEAFYADKGDTISFVKAKKKRAEDFGDEPNFLDESEDPEALEEGGIIDLGELAVQSFLLALDPYAVKPDAPAPQYAEEGDPVKVDNPFAVLGQLRDFMQDDK